MLDILLIVIALATGGGAKDASARAETLTVAPSAPAASSSEEAPPGYVPPVEDAPDTAGYEAEPQVQTGRFLTALEVKPILGATRANWIAVREFNGQDLVYVTQIWSWRCGLHEMRYAVNDDPLEVWPLPECRDQTATPASITEADGPPYRAYALGSVETVTVELLYDDLTIERATFNRMGVLLP